MPVRSPQNNQTPQTNDLDPTQVTPHTDYPETKQAKNQSFQYLKIGVLIVLIALIGVVAWKLHISQPATQPAQTDSDNLATQDRSLDSPFSTSLEKKQSGETTTIAVAPTKTPKRIPSGKTGFSVSGGKKDAPQFNRGELDPYDPQQGEKQTVTINLVSQSPISSAQATFETDNKKEVLDLNLVEGSDTEGAWSSSWVVDDSYDTIYRLTLTATNAQETQEATITLR